MNYDNRLLLISLIAIALIISLATIYQINTEERVSETNYEGLVKLGLAPSANSREPNYKDIDTKLNIGYEGEIYRLYESRSFEQGDFGKTFVRRIV